MIEYAIASSSPFQSFWMAGFECADLINKSFERVDLLQATGHLQHTPDDYKLIKQFHILTVREGIQWSKVEKAPYQYNWQNVEQMIRHGKANRIQQIWDICHFGYPDNLSPLDDDFTPRFVAVCTAFVKFYRSILPNELLIVTPINEVSFISWLGGENAGTVPYLEFRGWDVKYHLMKAFIAGTKAMLELDPTIRILTTEPLVNMVPPLYATEEQILEAAHQNELQFQTLDMLCGNICPELGGKLEYLDLLGFNFYYNNQWVIEDGGFLPWVEEDADERWRPLSSLLFDAYQRYGRPFVITETSHPGIHRPNWIEFIGKQCTALIQQNLPLLGVCLYPIIDRPDWDDLSCWHHSGLWDVSEYHNPADRILDQAYASTLQLVQSRIRSAQINIIPPSIENFKTAI